MKNVTVTITVANTYCQLEKCTPKNTTYDSFDCHSFIVGIFVFLKEKRKYLTVAYYLFTIIIITIQFSD